MISIFIMANYMHLHGEVGRAWIAVAYLMPWDPCESVVNMEILVQTGHIDTRT